MPTDQKRGRELNCDIPRLIVSLAPSGMSGLDRRWEKRRRPISDIFEIDRQCLARGGMLHSCLPSWTFHVRQRPPSP
jgi:hypothetical protein